MINPTLLGSSYARFIKEIEGMEPNQDQVHDLPKATMRKIMLIQGLIITLMIAGAGVTTLMIANFVPDVRRAFDGDPTTTARTLTPGRLGFIIFIIAILLTSGALKAKRDTLLEHDLM